MKSFSVKKSAAMLLAALMVFAFSACADNQEDIQNDQQEQNSLSEAEIEKPSFPELTVDSVEEQGEIVVVEISYGTVKFPYAFSDVVIVSAETGENSASLVFSAFIGGEEYPSYTLIFNGTEGIRIGSMKIEGEDSAVPVCVEFHEAGNMDEGLAGTFNAVQETFNDVLASLGENSAFVPEV